MKARSSPPAHHPRTPPDASRTGVAKGTGREGTGRTFSACVPACVRARARARGGGGGASRLRGWTLT